MKNKSIERVPYSMTMNISMYEFFNNSLQNRNSIREFFDERYQITIDWDNPDIQFIALVKSPRTVIGVSIIRVCTQQVHIAAMCVDKNWQHKGWGTKMLEYIIKKFKQYTITLSVTFEETHLLPFYLKYATITHTNIERGIFVLSINKVITN